MSLWTLGSSAGRRQLALHRRATTVAPQDAEQLPVPPRQTKATDSSAVLSALAKYIPAETTSLFLAAVNLLQPDPADTSSGDGLGIWAVYLVCALLTPLFVYLAARSTWRQVLPDAGMPFQAPHRSMAMSTAAFLVWGLAVPGVVTAPGAAVWAVLGALSVSPILVMIEQAFGSDADPSDM